MDFIHDDLGDGRKLRTFNVVDAFTRECLAITVDTSLPARRILPVLDQLVWRHELRSRSASTTARVHLDRYGEVGRPARVKLRLHS